jgi:hypothetical protein
MVKPTMVKTIHEFINLAKLTTNKINVVKLANE